MLLEDLIIWTNYEIEVAAYNGAGQGIFSHKVTEWTLQGGERERKRTTSRLDGTLTLTVVLRKVFI